MGTQHSGDLPPCFGLCQSQCGLSVCVFELWVAPIGEQELDNVLAGNPCRVVKGSIVTFILDIDTTALFEQKTYHVQFLFGRGRASDVKHGSTVLVAVGDGRWVGSKQSFLQALDVSVAYGSERIDEVFGSGFDTIHGFSGEGEGSPRHTDNNIRPT